MCLVDVCAYTRYLGVRRSQIYGRSIERRSLALRVVFVRSSITLVGLSCVTIDLCLKRALSTTCARTVFLVKSYTGSGLLTRMGGSRMEPPSGSQDNKIRYQVLHYTKCPGTN